MERSTMVNIRCDTTEEGTKLYNELRASLNGELTPHADTAKSPVSSVHSANLFPPADSSCPRCGGDLRERRSKTGSTFMGCSNYPSCKFVRNI
ncbi:MAG: topoisomerase DNA-binding C4 zinc finger domain-containing protein [bacterium]